MFGLDVYVEQQPDAASFGAGKWFISYVIMVNMIKGFMLYGFTNIAFATSFGAGK